MNHDGPPSTDEASDESLVEGAINGMLTALDPHSNYLNSKNFTDMKVQISICILSSRLRF